MKEIDFLLTGSTGFFGSILNEALSSEFSIATLSRNSTSDYTCDLSKEIPVLKQNIRIKNIIHTAGKAHVIPKTDLEDEEFLKINFQGTVHLTQAIEKLDSAPESFVFISTVAVYGREEGKDIDENHPLIGNTAYARSKIMAEEFLVKWCDLKNIRLTILRLPLIVGNNPPGNLGAVIQWMRRRLYIGVGTGAARRSMVLAGDVAKFIPVISKTGGIYNLTDGYNPSVKEFEKAIASELKIREPIRLPEHAIKLIANAGDFLGTWFPLNSARYKKLTSSLTFSDAKARKQANWNPRPVIHNLQLRK